MFSIPIRRRFQLLDEIEQPAELLAERRQQGISRGKGPWVTGRAGGEFGGVTSW